MSESSKTKEERKARLLKNMNAITINIPETLDANVTENMINETTERYHKWIGRNGKYRDRADSSNLAAVEQDKALGFYSQTLTQEREAFSNAINKGEAKKKEAETAYTKFYQAKTCFDTEYDKTTGGKKRRSNKKRSNKRKKTKRSSKMRSMMF